MIKSIAHTETLYGNQRLIVDAADLTAICGYYEIMVMTKDGEEIASRRCDSAEKALAECIRTESDILNRAELIEAATKQLKQFKATYEKSAKALYDLMNDVYTQSTMYNTFHSIHF